MLEQSTGYLIKSTSQTTVPTTCRIESYLKPIGIRKIEYCNSIPTGSVSNSITSAAGKQNQDFLTKRMADGRWLLRNEDSFLSCCRSRPRPPCGRYDEYDVSLIIFGGDGRASRRQTAKRWTGYILLSTTRQDDNGSDESESESSRARRGRSIARIESGSSLKIDC